LKNKRSKKPASAGFLLNLLVDDQIVWPLPQPFVPEKEAAQGHSCQDGCRYVQKKKILSAHNVLHQEVTPWSKIILGKLIAAQLVNKLPQPYVFRRFITVFTRISHWTPNLRKLNPFHNLTPYFLQH
jgi:hypothetical protein